MGLRLVPTVSWHKNATSFRIRSQPRHRVSHDVSSIVHFYHGICWLLGCWRTKHSSERLLCPYIIHAQRHTILSHDSSAESWLSHRKDTKTSICATLDCRIVRLSHCSFDVIYIEATTSGHPVVRLVLALCPVLH